MHVDKNTLIALEQRYRANLINCLSGFKPAILVGTQSPSGDTNLAMFTNVLHIGANPALLGLLVRPAPADTERHTLDNITATGEFTLNHVTTSILPAAHQTSARFPRHVSEFTATGLTPEWRDDCKAPYVKEAPVKIGLRLAEQQTLAINNTTLVIGEVQSIYLPKEILREDGSVDMAKGHIITSCGLDSYHATAPGTRYQYAKPDTKATKVT